MNKLTIKAIAKLTHVNIQDAVRVVRHNPLLGDEIDIQEELINLEESIDAYHIAGESLNKYPEMKQHLLQEKRLILKHCIGLIVRMLYGARLPRPYSSADIKDATQRLVRLVIGDAERANIQIEDEVIEVVQPMLNLRQRYNYWDKSWSGKRLPLPSKLLLPKLRA